MYYGSTEGSPFTSAYIFMVLRAETKALFMLCTKYSLALLLVVFFFKTASRYVVEPKSPCFNFLSNWIAGLYDQENVWSLMQVTNEISV